MYKIDLHTHSIASPDGGITESQYANALSTNLVDLIAVTDHNRIDLALEIRKNLGDRIIVGEEIMTTSGEIIGLYLEKSVRAGLTPLETVKQIKDQGGIVYIPHPFESMRSGLHPGILEELIDYVDIMEVCNGRAFLQNRSAQAVIWAKLNRIIGVASSDAHGALGLGRTYTRVPEMPNKDDLLKALGHGIPVTDRPGVRALLYPKYHVIRKKLKKASGK
jgi:predicted metal-dependent phosphoesterase TrpH